MLSQFVDANKIGGWVRAAVAAGLGMLVARNLTLASILDPNTQQAIGVAVSGIVVGVWSQLTKTDAAKIAAAAALPDVAQITVKSTATDGVAAAAADPTQTKVVKAP